MTKNNTLKYRVGQVEVFVKEIDGKVDKILINHFPHLENKVTRLTWLGGLNLLAIIAGILIAKFL